MKHLTLLLLCVISATLYAQQPDFDGHKWVAPYTLPTPKDWGVERFPIPILFAPEIPYQGVEDIRFAPGWAKATSDEYWSYAFLWYLDGKIEMSSEKINSNLKAYYTGLISSNGRNIPPDKLIPVVTSFKETQKDKGDLATYTGTIEMTDYMSMKPIILHGKVHMKSCEGRNTTFVFYELSPQPLTHTVWSSLDKLWFDFKCDKN